MRYLLAFIVPPFAILLCRRWFHFVVNLVLWLTSFPLMFFAGFGIIVWLLCTAYAIAICKTASLDKRLNRVVAAIQESRPTGIR